MSTIREATWAQIQELRKELERGVAGAASVAIAARAFAAKLSTTFDSIALARVFLVVPARALPPAERAWAETFAENAARPVPLADATPVLTLVGTAGVEAAWNDRARSDGHRAIPLVDKALVEGAPMIAELLASLRVELVGLSADKPAQLRQMSGGLNARFYVPDARSTVDARGRYVIANRPFVERYGIRTVFGMGGVYAGGALAAAILFTREELDAATVDRFPTFISTFKMATSDLVANDALF